MSNSSLQGELKMPAGTSTRPIEGELIEADRETIATRQDRPLSVEDLMAKAIERGDTATMEKLFEMRREMRTESAEMAFNAAMTKAQQEMRHVAANATNPQTRSKYATYDALDKMLRPIYTANGFAMSFNTGETPLPDTVLVLCELSHEGGFSKRYQVPMPADGKGAKGGDVMTKTHAVAAGMSYGMRYLVKMIWNVAVGEDDTDGNKPNEIVVITEAQVKELDTLIIAVGANRAGFLKSMQVEKLEDMRASEFARAKRSLEDRRHVKISRSKAADLGVMLDEIASEESKPAFLKQFNINDPSEISVGDYGRAIDWLKERRK